EGVDLPGSDPGGKGRWGRLRGGYGGQPDRQGGAALPHQRPGHRHRLLRQPQPPPGAGGRPAPRIPLFRRRPSLLRPAGRGAGGAWWWIRWPAGPAGGAGVAAPPPWSRPPATPTPPTAPRGRGKPCPTYPTIPPRPILTPAGGSWGGGA